jgi:SAM-dependent methyltransferase
MENDRRRWNENFLQKAHAGAPSAIVQKFYRLAGRGNALDIASGRGQNALFLAEKGFRVDALDISDVALKQIAGKHPNLHPLCIDLDTFDIAPAHYSLILNIRFLNRRLFPYIQEGLAPGGILIFETYLDEPAQPLCRDYLLRTNELLHAFLALRILFYREGRQRHRGETRQVASLVALKSF